MSQGMLAHAKEKNVYHALVKAELTEYLRDHSESFDLIVSADTLVYFGDLRGRHRRVGRSTAPERTCGVHARTDGRRQLGCRLPSATARPLQSRAGLCRAVAHVFGPAVENHPGRLAYGGRCA